MTDDLGVWRVAACGERHGKRPLGWLRKRTVSNGVGILADPYCFGWPWQLPITNWGLRKRKGKKRETATANSPSQLV